MLTDAVYGRGKCALVLARGQMKTDPWHPTAKDGSDLPAGPEYVRRARAACCGCPVKAERLEWALRLESRRRGDPYGVYGGLSPRERVPAVAGRRAAVLGVAW